MIKSKISKYIFGFLLLNIILFIFSFLILTPYTKVLNGMNMQHKKEQENEIKYKNYILNSKTILKKQDYIFNSETKKEINNK